MNLCYLLAALLSFALALALPSTNVPRPGADDITLSSRQSYQHTPKCVRGVHIIGVPGNDPSESRYGLLEQPVDAVKTSIPDSSSFAILYPTLHEEGYTARSFYAASHLRDRIVRYSETCPDTPIVLMGYSFGGIILLNLICGHGTPGEQYYMAPLSVDYQKYIMSIFAFGDESRVPLQSFDRGTCLAGHGVNPRTNSTGCDAYASIIRSYCDEGDPQCCGGVSNHAHHEYGKKYDSTVVATVRHDLAERRKQQPG